MRTYITRAATGEDLDPIRSIARRYDNLATWPSRPDYIDHELSSGALMVCEEEGQIAGFGAVLERSGISHLADLFVQPDRVGTGIGRALLTALFPPAGARVTFASSDPRAMPLYVKFGMSPIAPMLYLAGDEQAARRLADPGVRLVDAASAAIGELDRNASSRDRLQELDFLRLRAGAKAFVAMAGAAAVGYGFCRLAEVGDDNTPSAFLGPIGAKTATDAVRTAVALLRWAAKRAAKMTIPVFGPNGATPALLNAGFRIQTMDVFMGSRPGLIGLDRYFPSIELG